MRDQQSSVAKLPREFRDEINRKREAGFTLDQIMEHLRGLGVEVSRSALGRYTKKQASFREAIIRSQHIAEAIGRNIGDNKTSQVAQANVDLLHSLLLKFMVITEGDDPDDTENKVSSKDLMQLATAVERLAKASKTDFEQRLKEAVELERRQTKEQAAEVAAASARKSGLSADTVNSIKRDILGMD